ncbi:MAG: hypothetical protein KG028_00145 [Actinobacteria bacterium]|jgi:hypothetical protein|nr:hypothetical protein [Actinomycetota bacterium]
MRLTRISHRVLSLTAVAALAVAGCTGDEGEPVDTSTGSAASNETTEADEATGPGGTITLAGVQQTHPSGSTVAVTAITVDDAGHILIDAEALVAGERHAYLNSYRIVLVDDLGNVYEFVDPVANANIDIAQDHEADLTLAFVGPIDPGATRVSLGINANYDGTLRSPDEEYANTLTPVFTFEGLPLPGVGLDDEAAGPDDEVGLVLPEAATDVTGVVHEGPAQVRVEVTRIKVEPSLVTVTVSAHNTGDREKTLIQRPPELRAELDGESLGDRNPFEFVGLTTADGEVDRLTLGPGDEAFGEFAFRGVVPPEATGLRLGFQVLLVELDRGAPSTEENQFGSPAVVFRGLPLPEKAAEVSGDGDAGGNGDGEDR